MLWVEIANRISSDAYSKHMNNQLNGSILSVEGLNVFYENFQAVKNVSFSVRTGEIFGLLGPNGAGKTSTLSAVEGLLKPAPENNSCGP
jgi:ABC-2 type transport system ATP-binding protein